MVNYKCPRCSYSTNRRSSMENHLNRKKLCKFINLDVNPVKYKDVILLRENESFFNEIVELNNKIRELSKINKNLEKRIETSNNCGYIYVMYNTSFGENVYKIGCSKNPKNRLLDYTTSYLDQSIIKYTSFKFYNKFIAEKHIFELLKDYRIKPNREFFNLPLNEIIDKINTTEKLFKSN